ncbi:MAG TPA: hypothetical protein VH020_08200 [Stellaceae bacterium]|nr:hypothetical protein [Stellaceae bacterium]
MVERSLHHGPVTGMLDPILLSEMRQLSDGEDDLAAAQRTAMQTSWQLHAVIAHKLPKL